MDLICVGDHAVPLALPIAQRVSVNPSSNVGQEFVGVFQANVKVLRPVRLPFTVRARVVEEFFVDPFLCVDDDYVQPSVNVKVRLVRSCHVLTLPFKPLLYHDKGSGRRYRRRRVGSFWWIVRNFVFL